MMKKLLIFLAFIFIVILLFVTWQKRTLLFGKVSSKLNQENKTTLTATNLNPLSIAALRKNNYPGSNITIEQTLDEGSDYRRYLASYKSEGLKIYALLTIPKGTVPHSGWPIIVFNHGYIPPEQYRTTERYVAYVDAFAKNGYIVFKPDYRGHGSSEGQPEGAYYSPAYTVDDLNAISSVKTLKDSDPNKIGVWGHSMGGNITLRDLVVNQKDIKAAVIWGGVVGSYDDLLNNWQRRVPFRPSTRELAFRNNGRTRLIQTYGTPQANPQFWNSIDPTFFVSDVSAPIQLDVGGEDEEVPVAFSQSLREKLQKAGKTVEYFEYPGSDHNISQGFNLAMQRSLDFFDRYLK